MTSQWLKVLHEFHAAGVLRAFDLHLTEALARTHRVPETAPAAGALAIALASRAVGDGHICLEFTSEALVAICRETSAQMEPQTPALPAAAELLASVQTPEWAPLVGADADGKPLVLFGNRLYLRRLFDYEANVARQLHAMAKAGGQALSAAQEAQLQQYFDDLHQRAAARMALTRRLTIISGGPGTGKTYTAARILSLLASQAPEGEPLTIRLAAPTGKAAMRLEESIREAQDSNPLHNDGRTTIEPASTIDRMLGYIPNSPYFRHNKENPLAADVLLVDEASMIDLPKMAKLLDALPEECRLILLGDHHQLASVQPGSVLAELCAAEALAGCVTTLQNSRRFPADSPIGRLSRAINSVATAQEANAAWELLQNAGTAEGCRISSHASGAALETETAFAALVREGFKPLLASTTPAQAFVALAQFRILCALRHGPDGVIAVNRLVEELLATPIEGTAPGLRAKGEWYSHRVLMITRNDYNSGLFNGDIGIVLPDDRQESGTTVYFEDSKNPGAYRRIAGHMLPPHETAFAMTIHKSQGSEFDQVAIIMPERDSPVLTREILYTAITRAKTHAHLWCNKEIFTGTSTRSLSRHTALSRQLDNLL